MRITRKSTVAERMEEGERRTRNGPDMMTNQAVYDALVDANKAANFDPNHPKSIIDVRGFWGRIGAKHPRGSYVNALWIPTQIIAGLWKRWMVEDE